MSVMGVGLWVKELTDTWGGTGCKHAPNMSNFEKQTSRRRSSTVSLWLVDIYPPSPADPVYPDQQVMQAFQSAMHLLNQS